MLTEHRFSGIEELVEQLADHMEKRLSSAIVQRGDACMAVSGGSTPKPLFRALCRRRLPWSKVTLTLADERWVDPADMDSNEKMVRDCLLQEEAGAARFIPLKNSAASAKEGVPRCREGLSLFCRPFDLLLLGMGDDGHTASLFPGATALSAGLGLSGDAGDCLAVTPPSAPHERISLSVKRLLDSREIILLITGETKWRVYRDALAETGERAILEKPVAAILHQQKTPVRVFWAGPSLS